MFLNLAKEGSNEISLILIDVSIDWDTGKRITVSTDRLLTVLEAKMKHKKRNERPRVELAKASSRPNVERPGLIYNLGWFWDAGHDSPAIRDKPVVKERPVPSRLPTVKS